MIPKVAQKWLHQFLPKGDVFRTFWLLFETDLSPKTKKIANTGLNKFTSKIVAKLDRSWWLSGQL